MNDDTLTNLVAHGLVDKVIHLFNKYLGTQLKIRNEKRVLPYISKKRVMEVIQYTSLNSNYWQSHLYAYGRPPYN